MFKLFALVQFAFLSRVNPFSFSLWTKLPDVTSGFGGFETSESLGGKRYRGQGRQHASRPKSRVQGAECGQEKKRDDEAADNMNVRPIRNTFCAGFR